MSCAALVRCLLSPLLLQAPPAVIVPNAGFEEGGDAPLHWTASTGEGARGEFVWENGLAHSGERSFRVRRLPGAGYTDLLSDYVAAEPGRTYRVSAWVRPEANLPRGVYFMVNQRAEGSQDDQLPNTFGNTSAALEAGQWQQVTARVTVRPGNTAIRVHCIQAFLSSDVLWDDFEISEAGSEPPPRYDPPTREPLPDLALAEEALRARPKASAQVEVRDGRPRLVVEGRSVPWCFYVCPPFNIDYAQIADFRDAGVRVYLAPLMLGRGIYGDRGVWLGPGRYDFSQVDDVLWRILRVDPQAYILFYMGCDPYAAWGAEHPDDITLDQAGVPAIVDMHPRRWGSDPGAGERFGPSPVSQTLRADVSETLRALAAHVESSLAGKAVIGYHVAGFNDGQWFHWDRLQPDDLHVADYSPAAAESFRAWLAALYGSDEQLQRAWARPGVTLATAAPPEYGRYWVTDHLLLDPATEQDCIDWTRFLSEGIAETVEGLAGVLKAETPRPIICGTYYEDITCNSNGHIALGRHLASPSIDYLSGPAAYDIRMAGYPGAVRTVFGSTLLHGKVFVTEQDWRSWRSEPNSPEENFSWGRAENADTHNAMVRRECGMMLAFGLGTWWYDMTGGWFHDDQIMAGIAEARRAFERDLSVPGPARADLAVIVSEEGSHCMSPALVGAYRYNGIAEQVRALNTSGVPYRMYLLSDLGRPELASHRAYLFLNAYSLSPAQREQIERLKRDGKTLIFVHAPGAVGAADPARAISEVAGVSVRPASSPHTMLPTPLDTDPPLLEGDDSDLGYAPWLEGPAWAVDDAEAAPIATYAGSDQVAVAARDHGAWRSVFVGSPGLTDRFIHHLATWAGCWVAAEPGDAVYANERVLTIHAIFGGPKTLRLARPSRVTDLSTGEVLAESAGSIEIDMTRAQTRWFALD